MPKAAAASKTLLAAGCSQAMSWFLGKLGMLCKSQVQDPQLNVTLAWVVSFSRSFSQIDNEKNHKNLFSIYFQCSRGREGGAALLSLDFMNHSHTPHVCTKNGDFPRDCPK